MPIIYTIESSNNPQAINSDSKAAGLGQITPVALLDWNKEHPEEQYSYEDLFNEQINMKISDWTMNERIPFFFKNYGIADTIQNRLAAYNWGIKNFKKHIFENKKMPEQTKDYIIKYYMGGNVFSGQKKLKSLGFNPGPIDGILGPKTRKAWDNFQSSSVASKFDDKKFGISNLKEETGILQRR